MASGKKVLAKDVWVDRDGTATLLEAGKPVPGWAKDVLDGRDKLFVKVESPEGDAESGEGSDGGEGGGKYADLSFEDLRKLAKERELPAGGTAAALIERLEQFDAESGEGSDGNSQE